MLKLVTLTLAGLGLVTAQSDQQSSSNGTAIVGSLKTPTGSCKTLPGDPRWPTILEWNALSQKVGGNLIKYRPPGAVCSQFSGVYSATECAAIQKSYGTQYFSQNDPGAVNALWYTGNTCAPSVDPTRNCTQGSFPEYVLKARNSKDISEVLKFARSRNIRVVVKNTGHDFIGRSIGRGSIGIWMHEWQGYQELDSFSSGCPGSTQHTAAKLTGGIQFHQVYAAAAAIGKIIVGGSSGTVGPVGGYIPAGGHSAFGKNYGMAVDQVLEFEVVTPAGEITKVNECTRPDLFWALRGGGPGTFAVITSVTIKTYPEPKSINRGLLTIKTSDLPGPEEWWSMVNVFHSALGNISDANISGYYYLYLPQKYFYFDIYHVGATLDQTNATFQPLRTQLERLKTSNTTYSINLRASTWSGTDGVAAGFASDDGKSTTAQANTGALMSSRLLPRSAWEKDPDAWLEVLKKFDAGGATSVLGHLVSGGKVHENKKLAMGLLPAWRTAESHVIVTKPSLITDTPAQFEAKKEELRLLTKPLRDLTPGGGAYMNEGDLEEPNKYQAFFGANSPRLLSLKRRYDPTGTLYCGNCIGSDDYTVTDGRICRKSVLPPVRLFQFDQAR